MALCYVSDFITALAYNNETTRYFFFSTSVNDRQPPKQHQHLTLWRTSDWSLIKLTHVGESLWRAGAGGAIKTKNMNTSGRKLWLKSPGRMDQSEILVIINLVRGDHLCHQYVSNDSRQGNKTSQSSQPPRATSLWSHQLMPVGRANNEFYFNESYKNWYSLA